MPWGEVVRTDFTIQKALWTHTKKQKISNFFCPRWHAKSEPYHTWHNGRGGLNHSCTSTWLLGVVKIWRKHTQL